ncbi:MAG: VCBS repeat-containing protein [Planctomycetes bacterium]|nr:VCBS repeat-containing protein [Planctomycetota bacterium]
MEDGLYVLHLRGVDGSQRAHCASHSWIHDRLPPDVPRLASLERTGPRSLRLVWTLAQDPPASHEARASGVLGYRIYFDVGSTAVPDAPRAPGPPLDGSSLFSPLEGGSGSSPLFVEGASIGSFTLEGLFAARMHYVRVTAVDRAGNETAVGSADELAKRTGTGADGTLRAPLSLPVGAECGPLVVADFDRDGRSDLAVVDGGVPRVGLFYGRGDATFDPLLGVALPPGEIPVDVGAAEFSSDHFTDLVVLLDSGPTVAPWRGDRVDPFRIASAIGFGGFYFAMAVADYDRDFQPDLVTAKQLAGETGLRRESFLGATRPGGYGVPSLELDRGAFEPPELGAKARCLLLHDLDGRNGLDIVFCDEGSVGVQLRIPFSGRASYTATASYSSGGAPESIVVGHFDADAFPDLAVANGDGSVALLFGDGAGGFLPPHRMQVGSAPGKIASADFDGDSIPDLVVAGSIAGAITILHANGREGTFRLGRPFPLAGTPRGIAVADFDRDTIPDLAVSLAEGSVEIYRGGGAIGTGDGSFALLREIAGSVVSLATADFDRDGVADLAASRARAASRSCSGRASADEGRPPSSAASSIAPRGGPGG